MSRHPEVTAQTIGSNDDYASKLFIVLLSLFRFLTVLWGWRSNALCSKGYSESKIKSLMGRKTNTFSSKEQLMRTKIEIENDDDFIEETKNLF